MINAQEWLDKKYPNKNQIETIDLSDLEKIEIEQPNELIIDNYLSLKEVKRNCTNANPDVTKLTISNCPKLEAVNFGNSKNNQELILNNLPSLKTLNCWSSKLTILNLTECLNLESIHCQNNFLTKINLPNLGKKLKALSLSNNNFQQDLSFLEEAVNLEKLNISDTDIDSGLEYLPDSLEKLYCSADKRKNAKCQTLYNLFANEQGEVETEYGWIKNFPQKFQDYKTNLKNYWKNLNFTEEEIKSWENVGLKLNETELANQFKQKNYQFDTPNIKEIIKKESWRDIHPSFNYQLRKAWEKNFTHEETKEWITLGFAPQQSDYVLEWKKCFDFQQVEEWINIGLRTNGYDFARQWKSEGFTPEQTKEWVNTGVRLDDYEFIDWLKNLTPQWITNHQETYQTLSDKFKNYGLCPECNQPKNTKYWCRVCHSSGSQEVDDFIEKYQQKATNYKGIVEWIPYDKLTVEPDPIGKGGFGKIYKAKWLNKDNKKKTIVLKSLNNSSDIKEDFLQEIANHKMFASSRIVKCFGISQDPQTKSYLMVMDYVKDGDLRKFLQNNQLDFKSKLDQLWRIADGLKEMHKQGLTHRDFHSGNILNDKRIKKGIDDIYCYITDLGLCRPANVENKAEVYGQIPYVAPEILGKGENEPVPYTQASDVYSFGVMAYELLAVYPPYNYSSEYDDHDEVILKQEICEGKRPNLDNIPLPQLLKDLIEGCWGANPNQRPTASDLVKALNSWRKEVNEKKDTEFTRQVQTIEEAYNKAFKDKKYPQVNLFSKFISTGSVSSRASSRFNSKNFSEYKSKELDFDIEINRLDQEAKDLTERTKRQLSLETQSKTNQGETKIVKVAEIDYSEPMEIDYSVNWQNIHLDFTDELIRSWTNLDFAYNQAQDWIKVGFSPQDYDLVNFVKNVLKYDVETVLNNANLEPLRKAYERYLAQQEQQAQVQINPFNKNP